MTGTKQKIIAIVMAITLAFSMVSATALTAFASELQSGSLGLLQPQASSTNKVVYDSVYGVFGDYALMYKSVVYNFQYEDGTWGKRTGDVVDVVDVNGNVTVHTSPNQTKSGVNPGGWTDFDCVVIDGYGGNYDIEAGYIGVKNKNTGEIGVKKLDGSNVIPCSYDLVKRTTDGFVGITESGSMVKASFFSMSGAGQGQVSASVETDSYQAYRYGIVTASGSYLHISGRATKGSYSFYVVKKGSTYQKTSAPNVEFRECPEHKDVSADKMKLANGIVVKAAVTSAYDSKTNKMTYASKVTDVNGKPIKIKGYTLKIDVGSGKYPDDNRVKHYGADVWWAQDSSGRWGAIDSKGNVKVPFEYSSYYDCGEPGTDYALVKKGADWKIVNVKSGILTTDLSKATVASIAARVYTGKALKPGVTVKLNGANLKSGVDYSVSYRNNVKAGTARLTIKGIGLFSGSKSAKFKIKKAPNAMKVKARAKTVKASKLRVKAKKVSSIKFVKKASGKVTFKNVSKGKSLKKFKVNKKTGVIKVPKKTKTGVYKIKVQVKAKGDANHKSGKKTVKCKIKVK